MSATSHRRPTSEILAALETALLAIQWSGSAAFQRVEQFSQDDLVEAMKVFLSADQRIALIVPGDEAFTAETRGRTLEIKRSLPLILLLSDSILGDEEAALYGNVNTPGAYGLFELVLPAISGQLLANPHGVQVEPRRADVFKIPQKDLPGRAAVALEIECTGGYLEATLGLGPNY